MLVEGGGNALLISHGFRGSRLLRIRSRGSGIAQNGFEMLLQITVQCRLAANGVVVEDHPIASNIEWQLLTPLRQKDGWLVQRWA